MDGRESTKAVRRAAWRRACMLAAGAALLLPMAAHAGAAGWRKASDEEMRGSFARGLPDRPLVARSLYLGSDNAVEVLGDTAALLNPLAMLLDAETNFRRVVFNPANLAVLTDGNGAAYIRLFNYIDDATVDRARLATTQGASYGSVSLKQIDLRGTAIVVKRH